MKTIKEVAAIAGVITRTVQNRANYLGLDKVYKGESGGPVRYFTEEETDQIINYVKKNRTGKTKKISYELDGDLCITSCDLFSETMVCSIDCRHCGFFRGYNMMRQWVYCRGGRE